MFVHVCILFSYCQYCPPRAINNMLRRPITSGSRQAPDPYDQYLESRCMYRKHTARDASSLFRVIAEQMYDTQMLHYEVRLECVRFMTRKRRIFERHVCGDFDTYMLDMAKPKTYGTVLELRALCCMYRRNVILYEPFNLGTAVTYNENYQDNFRVFFTNEYHFDSVYTLEYFETAAICQSICFKLLYKMLFKLPDVNFAVETMLHPQTFNWGNYSVEFDSKGFMLRIICGDGRIFELDMPENTKCILENYKLCNFHKISMQQQQQQEKAILTADKGPTSDTTASGSNTRRERRPSLELPVDNESTDILLMCPNRFISCVRQLLNDGITPFPYKVAKSLDPYMYRNIEFDSWNDMRKEAKRYNVYANDYNFKVPYETVHPVPPDEFRPWSVPFRYQRQMQRMHLAKPANKPKWKKPKIFDMATYFEARKCDMQLMHTDGCYGFPLVLNEYPNQHKRQHRHHAQPHHQQEQHFHEQHAQHQQDAINEPSEMEELQQQGDPHVQSRIKQLRFQQQHQVPQQPPAAAASGTFVGSTSQILPPAGQLVNCVPMPGGQGPGQLPSPWLGSPLPMTDEFPAGVFPAPPMPNDGCMFMHFGGYGPPSSVSLHPPPPPSFAAPPFLYAPQPPQSQMLPRSGAQCVNSSSSGSNCHTSTISTITASAMSTGPQGCSDDQSEPRRSLHPNGIDLPVNLNTIRYFYNMGVDLHMRMSQAMTPEESLRMSNNNQNFYNTDQQQQQQHHKQRIDEATSLVSNTTPPPSPEAAIATLNTASYVSSNEPPGEKSRARSKRGAFNKARAKRPEQLLHGLNKDNQLSHAMLLPTPTPSPNTNVNQFNFYSTAQPPLPPLQQPLVPPPVFFGTHNPVQNTFAWGMAQPPVAPAGPGGANMVSVPFEMLNNYNMEPNGAVNPQQPSSSAGYPPTTPRH